MKRMICWLALVFGVAQLPAQNPRKSGTSAMPDSQCGPIGCVAPGTSTSGPGASAATTSGAPVVIRDSIPVAGPSAETQAKTGMVTPLSDGSRGSLPEQPPEPPTAFEQFVQASLGHGLPRFGSLLFGGTDHSFAPPTQAAPPSDYVLGTGDEVLIRTWGKIDIDVRVLVDRNGQIFLPRVGTLSVAGLPLNQLSTYIQRAISQQFTGFDLSVSLGQLRSIQIFLLGQARAPGVYTISSLSTLVNALFLTGGPSNTGTLRDIQVKRGGAVLTHFDVYRLLLSGDKVADVRLLPGDIIFIPALGPQVAVDGDVGAPAIYEISPGATVGDVLADAGGLTPVAGTARAVLEHVLEHTRRSIEELALDAKGLAIPLNPGDILRVFPISPRIVDAVTLRGNVAAPGRYAWHAGMRVSDLIPSRDFLLTRDYFNRQNALDVPGSSLSFRAMNAGGPSPTDTNAPPQTATHDTEINWNYAVVERLDTQDLTTRMIPFALGEALARAASEENKTLLAGDVVVVYAASDVALPLELQAKFVRVDGQVKAPGVYRVGQDETLRELVERAGGLVPHAYLYAARLTRESVQVEQEGKLKALIRQQSLEILSPANQRQSVAGGGSVSVDVDLRKAYIAELGNIHPDGRVVLQLKPESSEGDVPDFLLEDGDHFFVPSLPNTVDVLGNVYNQGALRYLAERHARSYLDAAGGATRDGDRKREFILRADGTIVSRQNVGGLERLQMHPGDAFVVPPKLKAAFSVYDALNFTQALSSFAITAAAIKGLQ